MKDCFGLVNVEPQNVTQEFSNRVARIADEFSIQLSVDELRKAYALRSKLAHGESFLFNLETKLPKEAQRELYDRLESVLRNTVRRCLDDETFGNFFRDGDAVKRRWKLK